MTIRKVIAACVTGMLLALVALVAILGGGGAFDPPVEDCVGGDVATAVPIVEEGPSADGIGTAARAALAAWDGDQGLATIATAIAGPESGYRVGAKNPTTTARGLWQIMMSFHAPKFAPGESWRDAYANARVARQVWDEAGQSWGPWVAYTSGKYRQYIVRARAAVIAAVDTAPMPDLPITQPDPAEPTGNGPLGVKPHVLKAAEFVRTEFGFTGSIGGFADRNIGGTNTPSEHSKGLAIDVMVSAYTDKALGDRIAGYFSGPGAAAWGVNNVIWNRQVTNAGRGWAWGPYTGKSPHTDHVHIDFHPDGGNGVVPVSADPSIAPAVCTTIPALAGGAVVHPLPVGSGYVDQDNWGGGGPNWARGHTGNDYSVACGTPVLAAHDGTIEIDTTQPWAGPWLVKVTTGPETLSTWYAHMQAVTVNDGDVVTAGTPIGEVGTLGNSTGCHLHFEVHPSNGTIYEDNVDPVKWLAANIGRTIGGGIIPAGDSPGGTATIIGANIKFPLSEAAYRGRVLSLLRESPDALLMQESHDRNAHAYARAAGPGWRAIQGVRGTGDGVMASPIIYDASRFNATGGTVLGFHGHQYDRYWTWAALRSADTSFAVISGHLPLRSYDRPGRPYYRTMMGNLARLAARLEAQGYPVIVEADWNASVKHPAAPFEPVRGLRSMGMVTNWSYGDACAGGTGPGGAVIDGFGFNPRRVSLMSQGCLSKAPSDHKPVWVQVRLGSTRGAT